MRPHLPMSAAFRDTRPPVSIRAGIGLPKKAALYTMNFPPEQRLVAS